MWILIVTSLVHYGVVVSQQEYRTLEACKNAENNVSEMTDELRKKDRVVRVVGHIVSRCVMKSIGNK